MTDSRAERALRLGAALKEYRPAAGAVRKVLWVAFISLCIAALFLFGAVSELQAREWGGVVGLSVLGLAFISPAVLGGYVLFQGRGARVGVHERGFRFQRGRKDSIVLWSEIESYIVATAVRVVTKSGEVVELGGGIEGIDEIAQTIWDQTLKLMLPQIKAVLMSGSNAEFKGWKLGGKFLANYMGARSGFTVDTLGITEKDTGRRILWSAVTGYEVADETLGTAQMPIRVFRITDLTQTFATRADLLSNAHVLLALCAEFTTPNAARS
ncbi:MAG TPA: hypothetical protein VGF76_04955 [Polyangiaceae bacterium]